MKTDKVREFELYRELQSRLAVSRVAFESFQIGATSHPNADLERLHKGGARMLPGWVDYLQIVAFPLNQKSEETVLQIAALTPELPQPLQVFLRYQEKIKAKYEEWKRGDVCDYDLTAGFNFPTHLDEYIDQHLAALAVLILELQLTQNNRGESMSKSAGIFGIGFLAGLGTGRFFGGKNKTVDVAAPPALPVTTGPADSPTTTTNPSDGSTMLIESLRGISAAGDGADILTIHVLGLERAKLVAMRGTKGINRDEATKFVRFVDMSTEHLENTLKFGRNVSGDEKRIIESILEDRMAADGASPVDDGDSNDDTLDTDEDAAV